MRAIPSICGLCNSLMYVSNLPKSALFSGVNSVLSVNNFCKGATLLGSKVLNLSSIHKFKNLITSSGLISSLDGSTGLSEVLVPKRLLVPVGRAGV